MPKISYSQKERQEIRNNLITTCLEFFKKKGVQHTTIQEIYEKVGISRTFFYTFFSTKEDLIIEAIYLQQPKLIAYAENLINDSNLNWYEAIKKFLYACCLEENFVIFSIEEQQILFNHISEESYINFRNKQYILFSTILKCFNVKHDKNTVNLFINLVLSSVVSYKAIPNELPFLVPEAAKQMIEFQIDSIISCLENNKLK